MKKAIKTAPKVLICDPLDAAGEAILLEEGLQLLHVIKAPIPELKKAIRNVDAAVVRSGTKLTGDILREAKNLKIVGRAGVGIDNVDVETASKQGIVVVNTPSGNTISAAEHTMSLMLAVARNIAPAHKSMCDGLWERKKFTGVEVFEKTLGLIGLGRIGAEVAKRAQSFGMRVLACDPFLRDERARDLGVNKVTLEELYRNADFISLHTPKTPETKGMINAEAIGKMKKGVRIVNCARGGLMDEEAVLKALQQKKIAAIALDVYETEPPPKSKLLEHPGVLKTPHLGASTEEAQLKVSLDIARTVTDFLAGKGIRNAVNVFAVEPELRREMEPFVGLAEKIGAIQAQLVNGQFRKVEIRLAGRVAEYPSQPLVNALLKGLLTPILAEDVNAINAPFIARERGIKIVVAKSTEGTNFANLIRVSLKTDKEVRSVSGTLFSGGDPRIVQVDDLRLEFVARGALLAVQNKDVPGMVGVIGTLLGKNRVNIADMSVGRNSKTKRARIFINVDGPLPEKLIKTLKSHKNIIDARFIRL